MHHKISLKKEKKRRNIDSTACFLSSGIFQRASPLFLNRAVMTKLADIIMGIEKMFKELAGEEGKKGQLNKELLRRTLLEEIGNAPLSVRAS